MNVWVRDFAVIEGAKVNTFLHWMRLTTPKGKVIAKMRLIEIK